jgi:hypothetical protein
MHDAVTLLTTRGPLATKHFTPTGDGIATESYGNAKHFRVDQITVGSLAELADALDRLQAYRRSFLVRGEPLAGIDRARCRRLAHPDPKTGDPATLREQARRWLLLDFDSVEGAPCDRLDGAAGAAWLRERLPAPFHGAACWWAHSSSAGIKPGLRMRLGFWLSRPLTGDECGRLLAAAPVDHALFGWRSRSTSPRRSSSACLTPWRAAPAGWKARPWSTPGRSRRRRRA